MGPSSRAYFTHCGFASISHRRSHFHSTHVSKRSRWKTEIPSYECSPRRDHGLFIRSHFGCFDIGNIQMQCIADSKLRLGSIIFYRRKCHEKHLYEPQILSDHQLHPRIAIHHHGIGQQAKFQRRFSFSTFWLYVGLANPIHPHSRANGSNRPSRKQPHRKSGQSFDQGRYSGFHRMDVDGHTDRSNAVFFWCSKL